MKDQLRKIFDVTCLGFSSHKLDQDMKIESAAVLMFIIVIIVGKGYLWERLYEPKRRICVQKT